MMILAIVLAAAFLTGSEAPAGAAPSPGQQDAPPRDLNTHHCLAPPGTAAEWDKRRVLLRTQILVSAGLWPMPNRTPLRPIVTGRIEQDDFVVENVAIETLPGFRLCGNLYRPRGKKGPFPAIANPHGHWSHGRLEMQADVERAAPPPAKPAEGRANLTAIGVNLARQGFVVFAYDMVGYNDTNQVNHQFAGSLRHWYRGVSLMGLQLWNSIRVVDYLCSRPDVDRTRIGVTGASGGGTQTFLLTAVDDRISASVPVNMVSAYMQGGCLCENGPGLRLGTDNVEIAALAAPRPLLLIAATGDWTSHVPGEEWPAIRAVYALHSAADRTECAQFNYGHNYNIESREAMYAFFAKWLRSGAEATREKPFQLDAASLRVWNESKPAPQGLLGAHALADAIAGRSRDALLAIWPKTPAGRKRFTQQMRPALGASLAMGDLIEEPVKQARTRSRAALVVTVEGRLAEQAAETAARLRSAYPTVQHIQIPDTQIDVSAWWTGYRSCYNPTPLAVACRRVATEIARLASRHGRIDLIGFGDAGPVVLFARAMMPVRGAVACDLSIARLGEEERLQRMYAPCLEALGGLATAAALTSPSPVIILGSDEDGKSLLPPGFGASALNLTVCAAEASAVSSALQHVRVP